MIPEYEVFAIRYATVERQRSQNFISIDAHDGPMPMDYFVWLIRGAGAQYLVDTGFNSRAAVARRRKWLRCPIIALKLLGVSSDHISDVIVTHMHYDHAGNIDLLPRTRLHLQESELGYTVSGHMQYKQLRHSYAVDDVREVVKRLYSDEVVFRAGDEDLAPGIRLLHVGGHTAGLQAVRVHTARGWVVLASDASHYYDNLGLESPFPIVHDVGAMLRGYRKLLSMAESPMHVIPGHDPEVMRRYPAHGRSEDQIVSLHLDPVPQSQG